MPADFATSMRFSPLVRTMQLCQLDLLKTCLLRQSDGESSRCRGLVLQSVFNVGIPVLFYFFVKTSLFRLADILEIKLGVAYGKQKQLSMLV